MKRALAVALLALFASGCTADTGDGEDDEDVDSSADALSGADRTTCNPRIVTDREARRAFDPTAPILLFYGAYHGKGDSKDNLRLLPVSSDPSKREYVTVADASAVCGKVTDPKTPPAPEYNEWRARGGRVARKMNVTELENTLEKGVDFASAKIKTILDAGYTYVSIDELRTGKYENGRVVGPNTEWQNDGASAKRFAALLAKLEAMGLDRRIIFFANAYHMSDDGLPASSGRRLSHFSKVLRDCALHCRVLGLEIYLSARNIARADAAGEVPGDCYRRGMLCIERLAEQFIAAGGQRLRRRMVTVIGVSDIYTDDDAQNRCANDSTADAITRQYANIHAHDVTADQPGIGFYSLARAGDGPAVQADCLARRNRFVWKRAF